jgi:hypothetical protein
MNPLKEFFLKFFKNLGCKVSENGECLNIIDIPSSFEKFSGKKGPYAFCFESPVDGYEFVGANHYIINSMKDFLEGRGETTLLKFDVNFDPKKELESLIPLRNCEVKSFSKVSENKFLFRFSFATVFQYLNEKEQIINNIYIRDGEIIDFDESFELSEGNKRDVKEIVFDNEYELSKNKLKEMIEPKKNEISLKLNDMLKKEISRIEIHYKNRLDEVNKDSLKKQIHKFDEENSPESFKEEEKTLIEHEVRKHALSIKNRLLNVSIICYPIYNLNVVLNSGSDNRMIQIDYDPIKKSISPLFCMSCKTPLDEIIICTSGHLICRNCGERCEICGGVFCKMCSEKLCSFCSKKVCSNCGEICEGCKKTFCKNHAYPINDSGKKLCRNCIKRCCECGLMIEPGFIKKIGENFYCLKCFNAEKGKKILDDVFER